MKYKFITVVCTLLNLCILINAQVGINTSDGKGIFHLDGAKDNTSSLSASQLKNDVIVDGRGALGAGMSVVTPQAKVDVSSDQLYGAFRMVDGGENYGMILLGNKEGYAKWGMLKGSGGYRLDVTSPTAAIASKVETRLVFDSGLDNILISEDADYIVMIRLTGLFKTTAGLNRMNGTIKLYKNNTSTKVDGVEFYVGVVDNQKFSTYVVFKASGMKTGDRLILTVMPSNAAVSWTLDLSNTSVFFYRV
ncbi:hypothetical protein [Dysgonomonas sp. GY617]|uniref:hypothetical protein n=1 Tax=Dysgonomonas sp. GY617 TaxID=2780420 RepID=UPI0018839E32|nr:hypothetical protein [Dysgonomonas sp. GY617]MBF0577952.1 hypothetical protein [Dysgonomonas sp. GY617]